MLRRNLLRLPAFAALLGLAGPLRAAVSGLDDFHQALEKRRWLLAFRSVPEFAYEADARIRGRLPEGLRGSLFRNGPARYEIGDFRYQHWFDGDGMVQAFRFADGGIRHQARIIETNKFRAEQQAGRALYAGFGTLPPDPRPVTSPDTTNTGNISMLAHGGSLYALWEAGSPWRIDPESLDTLGAHAFSPETRGAPFSAHPRIEPDGTLWNFGYSSGAGMLVLWHLDAAGRVRRTGLVPCTPMGMPHDFVVTERHLVLLIPPFHYEPDEATRTFMQAHRWHPERPTRVLVVDKADFSQYQWLELPAQWVFHFGNGWEDGNGVIHFDGARNVDPLEMIEGFARVMDGESYTGSPTRHHRYTLDTRAGTVREEPMFEADMESEFPVIDPRVSGRRNHRLVMLSRSAAEPHEHPMLDSVTVYDADRDRATRFRYPAGVVPEEHLFVPAPGSAPEGNGWVVGTALNYATERTELHVFDVEAVDAGPVASAELPYALPLGLHGKYVAA
ncbi:MAG: carotenoid oxygenase family protein [Pseudomonadales bacterium]